MLRPSHERRQRAGSLTQAMWAGNTRPQSWAVVVIHGRQRACAVMRAVAPATYRNIDVGRSQQQPAWQQQDLEQQRKCYPTAHIQGAQQYTASAIVQTTSRRQRATSFVPRRERNPLARLVLRFYLC